jgi:hypothetical protein
MTNTDDDDAVKRAILDGVLSLWHGGIMELRSFDTGYGTQSGYYDDPALLSADAYKLDRQGVPGVYVTLNPVPEPLFAAAPNMLRQHVREATKDDQIVKRIRLLIDLDADREEAKSNATDAEHEAALDLARLIRDDLDDRFWERPLFVDSGNGAHLIYTIDLPNVPDSKESIKAVLRALAKRWNNAAIHVDLSVSNAARVVKIPGTMARKGPHTSERPHRRSRILELPVTR